MTVYAGVSNTARQAEGIYVGVNNVARKVKRAYVGDENNVARLVYEDNDAWWLAGGSIAASACLGAFKFKNAASQSDALLDLSESGNNLSQSGSISWAASTGFYLAKAAYLQNTTINNAAVKTVIIYFSGLPTTEQVEYRLSEVGSSGKNLYLYARLKAFGFFNGAETTPINTAYPVCVTGYTYKETASDGTTKRYTLAWKRGSAKLGSSGVCGFSPHVIYSNGVAMATTGHSATTESCSLSIRSNHKYTIGRPNVSLYFLGAAFYDIVLSAAQHLAIANAMLEF